MCFIKRMKGLRVRTLYSRARPVDFPGERKGGRRERKREEERGGGCVQRQKEKEGERELKGVWPRLNLAFHRGVRHKL